jgi:hypothetical protein
MTNLKVSERRNLMKICKKLFLKVLITLIVLTAFLTAVEAKSFSPDSSMIGLWEGQGKIIINWCKKKTLPVSITINTEGKVSGKVGDSPIKNGILRQNSKILRFFGNSAYLITADLVDLIIAEEKIFREKVNFIIDFKNNRIVGDLRTSGSKFGGKDSMALTVTNLQLIHK